MIAKWAVAFCLGLTLLTAGAARPLEAAERPVDITEYAIPHSADVITGGADGAVWFAGGGHIGYVVPRGDADWFDTDFYPSDIQLATDGQMWVAGTNWDESFLAVLTDLGELTKIAHFDRSLNLHYLTPGEAGDMWLAAIDLDTNSIVRVSGQGDVTQFPAGGQPQALAAGADGRIWFARALDIVAMANNGALEVFGLPSGYKAAFGLVRGADDAMWYTVADETGIRPFAVVRLDSVGASTVFPVPQTSESTRFQDMAVGPDGRIWMTTSNPHMVTAVTVDGSMVQYPLPDAGSPITAGPDGAMWIAATMSDKLMAMSTAMKAQDYAPAISGTGRVGSPLTCAKQTWPAVWSTGMEWVRDGWVMPWTQTSYTPTPADEDVEFLLRGYRLARSDVVALGRL